MEEKNKLYYRNTAIEVKPGAKFRMLVDYHDFRKGQIVYFRKFGTYPHFSDNEDLSYEGENGCLHYNNNYFPDEAEPLEPLSINETPSKNPDGLQSPNEKGGEKQMAEFRDGDTIRMLDSCSGCEIGEKYTIKADSELGLVTLINGNRRCNHKNLWELVSHANENMSDTKYRELTEFQKENWTPDTQALYRAGIISANGEIESNIAFSNALLRLNIKPLAKQATEDIAKAETEAEIAKRVK